VKDEDKDKTEEEVEPEIVAGSDSAQEEAAQIQQDLDSARSEAADYLDNLKRLQAEFENFRKRMVREQTDFLSLATQEIIKSLLPVIDNFERALAHEVEGDQAGEYRDGMQLVYAQLLDVLAKEGLSAVEPVGEVFDPSIHEAMMQVEGGDHPEGTIVRVLEKGYTLKGRVIRPAKVAVAG